MAQDGYREWPAGVDVYPKTLPPLRSDRDTVLVGTTKSLPCPGGDRCGRSRRPEKLTWDIPQLDVRRQNSYLVTLVDQAKVDGGRTLPLIDCASLANAKQEIEAGGRGLDGPGPRRPRGGNHGGRRTLADEALRRDPNDQDAQAIKDAVPRRRPAESRRPGGGPAAAPKSGAPWLAVKAT